MSDPRPERLVVIGGGQAAAQIIEVARQSGFTGDIALVTDEPCLPYQRPPLSKQYLAGKQEQDWLLYRPESFYTKFAVETHLERRAVSIDRNAQVVELDDGQRLEYDRLAIATGARARPLPVPGGDLPDVYMIRTIGDVDPLRDRLPALRRLVIIGGGFIGLETAAVLVQLGIEVTLLAAGERLIPKLVDGEVARFLLDHHLMHGVRIELNASVKAVTRRPEGGLAVELENGRSFAGDIVLVGIGAIPNVELAEAAGLVCNNGIVVDEYARTSDPRIVAAGDCTNHPNPLVGGRLRLETVHNAVEQGRTAGATVAGVDLPYIQSPWVWSDQYRLRLQSVGVSEGYDHTVVRGDIGSGRFSLFYFAGGQLLAVNCINQPKIFGAVRRILNEHIPLSPEQAGDPQFDLAKLPPPTATLDFDVPWPEKHSRTGTWSNADPVEMGFS